MNRLNSLAATVVALSLLAPSVAFKLLNDSNSVMEFKVGDEIVKLDAGKFLSVNLPVGARVLCSSATPLHQPGSIITEVTSSLDGAIIHVK